MPKVGDVVLYSFQKQTYNALVLALNVNHPDLLGSGGEPMLHLLFLAPDRESQTVKAKFTYIPESFTEYDVPHVSAKKGNSGAWNEVPAPVAELSTILPPEAQPDPANQEEASPLRRAVRLVRGSKAK